MHVLDYFCTYFFGRLFTLKVTIRGRSAGQLLQALSESITTLENGWYVFLYILYVLFTIHIMRLYQVMPQFFFLGM